MLETKKKPVSKRSKKSWRKNVDINDVESFLEDQRLVERLGGSLDEKKDDELFFVSTKPFNEDDIPISRKEKAKLPPKCFANLHARSAVPDPVGKRNRLRSKEERKHPIRRKIEAMKRAQGIIPKKVMEANLHRQMTYKKNKLLKKKNKNLEFNTDAWAEVKTELDSFGGKDWLMDDTIRHTLTNTRSLRVQVPNGIRKKTSVLPTIEAPHPGVSYNPSYRDHQDLLGRVAEHELKIQKEEEHLKRVTTGMFSKVTAQENEVNWITEMSEGLEEMKNKGEGGGEEEKETGEENGNNNEPLDNEYKAINPPTSFEKKKTRKQRRIQREQRELALKRKEIKIEKKKIADIYKLRHLNSQLENTEKVLALTNEKKKLTKVMKEGEPKRLAKMKYEDPGLEFSRSCELRGNLRGVKPARSLLIDRFYSFQKRNILAPTVRYNKTHKAKVKRFVKAAYKMEDTNIREKTSKKKTKKLDKIIIH